MRISVFGLGYVGCVTAACLAKDGHRVLGVDVTPSKVVRFGRGLPTVVEPRLDALQPARWKPGSERSQGDRGNHRPGADRQDEPPSRHPAQHRSAGNGRIDHPPGARDRWGTNGATHRVRRRARVPARGHGDRRLLPPVLRPRGQRRRPARRKRKHGRRTLQFDPGTSHLGALS
ncbi:MAG: hypothetical protein E6J76_15640 [Deltaproteobacteria bacterium]|nr:MAG: hypothetical protein E6J76_15640 [Deltaproteobacteria bacterium]